MKLPNCEKAYIPASKLSDYLLSKTHPVGKWKAKFFNTLGFDETNTDIIENRLLSIAHSEEIKDVIELTQGKKYIVDGSLQTPKGDLVNVRTIWIVETDQNRPRFVTAYPNIRGPKL